MTILETAPRGPDELARTRSAAWGAPFVLGLLITLCGVFLLAANVLTSLVTVLFLGGILVAAGVLEIIQAIRVRKRGPTALLLLGGLLSGVVGALMLFYPMAGLATLSLLVAGYFFASGLFRGITAVMDRYPRWGWDLLYGVLAVGLGVIVMVQWPASSLWLVGTLVAIEVIFRGAMLMSGALQVRRTLRALPA